MQINLHKQYELRTFPQFDRYIIQCRCIDENSEWERFGDSSHADEGLAKLFIHLIVNRMPNIEACEKEVQHG